MKWRHFNGVEQELHSAIKDWFLLVFDFNCNSRGKTSLVTVKLALA